MALDAAEANVRLEGLKNFHCQMSVPEWQNSPSRESLAESPISAVALWIITEGFSPCAITGPSDAYIVVAVHQPRMEINLGRAGCPVAIFVLPPLQLPPR